RRRGLGRARRRGRDGVGGGRLARDATHGTRSSRADGAGRAGGSRRAREPRSRVAARRGGVVLGRPARGPAGVHAPPPAGGDVGAAWVFTRSAGTWSQEGPKLTASDEQGPGTFGASVALSADGNTALVGGPADNASNGAAWVFTRSGETWTQQGSKLTPSDPN